jgi:hypothetical protein
LAKILIKFFSEHEEKTDAKTDVNDGANDVAVPSDVSEPEVDINEMVQGPML